MNFNWSYFPLEGDGVAGGVQNPLPAFTDQTGLPWTAANSWFNGNGVDTSLITSWAAAPTLFNGVALPDRGSYLIGFQVELGEPSSNPVAGGETILFSGYSGPQGIDGLRVAYKQSGVVEFSLSGIAALTLLRSTTNISNGLHNIFYYIDHRPVGTGIDAAFVHTYQDGTDIKKSAYIRRLYNIGGISPREISAATSLAIGAMPLNGSPQSGTHFQGKIRRLHLMKFGEDVNADPSNLAQLMGELSKARMIPTPQIQQLMGFSGTSISRAFVRFA